MIDYNHPTAVLLVDDVRRRHRRVTPYRIGFEVGMRDMLHVEAPYKDPRCLSLYRAGVRDGQSMRVRAQQILDTMGGKDPTSHA